MQGYGSDSGWAVFFLLMGGVPLIFYAIYGIAMNKICLLCRNRTCTSIEGSGLRQLDSGIASTAGALYRTMAGTASITRRGSRRGRVRSRRKRVGTME